LRIGGDVDLRLCCSPTATPVWRTFDRFVTDPGHRSVQVRFSASADVVQARFGSGSDPAHEFDTVLFPSVRRP